MARAATNWSGSVDSLIFRVPDDCTANNLYAAYRQRGYRAGRKRGANRHVWVIVDAQTSAKARALAVLYDAVPFDSRSPG